MDVFEIKKIFASLSGTVPSSQDKADIPVTMTAAYAQKLYQQLEMEPPDIQFYREAISIGPEDQALIQLHAHPFYELIYCREPHGMEYLIGHTIYKLDTADVVLVPPGVSHRLLLPEQPPSTYTWDVLWLSRKFIDTACPLFSVDSFETLQRTPVFRAESSESSEIGDTFHRGILEAERKAPGWVGAMAGSALLVLSLLLRSALRSTPVAQADQMELIDQILFCVEAHLSEKISVSQVAKQFYVSESTVCQTFRKKMGVSFYRCLTQRRLVLARTLIAEGHSTMDAVAQQAGFSDYSAFYRAFKREFGISPREYRKEILRTRE